MYQSAFIFGVNPRMNSSENGLPTAGPIRTEKRISLFFLFRIGLFFVFLVEWRRNTAVVHATDSVLLSCLEMLSSTVGLSRFTAVNLSLLFSGPAQSGIAELFLSCRFARSFAVKMFQGRFAHLVMFCLALYMILSKSPLRLWWTFSPESAAIR